MASLWNFGGSWAAAHGLHISHGYAAIIAKKFNMDFVNTAQDGESFIKIYHDFLANLDKIKQGDLILVTVPPDTRWATIRDYGSGPAIFSASQFGDGAEYDNFVCSINGYTEWFRITQAMWLRSMIACAKQQGASIYFWHNYGHMDLAEYFNIELIKEYFVDYGSSMWHCLGFQTSEGDLPAVGTEYNPYSTERDGPPLIKDTVYAIPGDNHPSILGHKKLAEKIYDHIRNK